MVDVEEIISREPALASSRAQIAGGILCPTDETGDSAKFTRALAAIVEARGGKILTGTRIGRIERQGDRVTQILTDQGRSEERSAGHAGISTGEPERAQNY